MSTLKEKYTSRKPAFRASPDSLPVLPEQKKPAGKARKLIRLVFAGMLLSLVLLAIACPNCLRMDLKQGVFNFLFSFFLFGSLWYVNNRLSDILDERMPWLQGIGKRFIITMLATLLISTAVVLVLNIIFMSIRGYSFKELETDDWKSLIIFPIVITFLISLFMHSRGFLLDWRQTAIDAERLQKENISSQYESLKAQVNPHFLFNSLNALTSLVETDQKQAVKFIRKLSEVYRYVLDSRQMEVVPLADELVFLESYIYLQQIRHGEALQVQNDLPQRENLMVVPLALQMLLENAVKHNIALEEEPLQIRLYLEHDYIAVQNNLQVRRIKEESTGTGLKNIEARYSYLTDKQVQVQHTEKEFTVKLPALYIKA